MTTILCVEDEEAVREDIVEELRDAGYETLEARNGKEGLDTILATPPDLVLCDITMPVMDGHELLETLRRDHAQLADLPFVFLSALADRDHILAGKKLGADDYLTKPIDFEMLLATVESRLSQVGRMQTQKDAQLVKLYKALAMTPGGAPADKGDQPAPPAIESGIRISVVIGDREPARELILALRAAGHKVTLLESGRRLVADIDSLSPDLLLISTITKDLQAPMAVKLLSHEGRPDFPVVLLVPEGLQGSVTQMDLFDGYIQLPCKRADALAKLSAFLG